MAGEIAPQGMGFFAQMREKLKQEPISLEPVTDRNFPHLRPSLVELSDASTKDGLLPMTGNPQETPEEWASTAKALWIAGKKDGGRFIAPENITGFVNLYAPTHEDVVNDWLVKRNMHAYNPGELVEVSAFAKDGPEKHALEISAYKLGLGKAFTDESFKDIRASTLWVTHNDKNAVEPSDMADMKKLGGFPIGTMKYAESEAVDSTCFLITRNGYLDALSGKKRLPR